MKYKKIPVYIYSIIKDRIKTFVVTFLIGLATHMYMFTNLFVNHDTTHFFFGLGNTSILGRWGLEVLNRMFTTYNMPWLNGIVTLAFISASACVILEMLEIKKSSLQYLFGGLFITVPVLTATYMYMFTSVAYALAIFLSSVAMILITKKGRENYITALICLVFSVSIYQAYAFLFSSFIIVYLIKCNFESDDKNKLKYFKEILKYLLFFIISLAVYYIINIIFMKFTGVEYNDYAKSGMSGLSSSSSVIDGILHTYICFFETITGLSFGMVTSDLLSMIYLSAILFIMVVGFVILKKNKPEINILIFMFLVVIMPISIYGTFVVGNSHILTLYSFTSLYGLLVLVVQQAENYGILKKFQKASVRFSSALMALIISFNIFTANRAYIKLDLANRMTTAFYTTLTAQIKSTPGFLFSKKVALVGDYRKGVWYMDEFGKTNFGLPCENWELINSYSKNRYIKYLIGFDANFASEEEIKLIHDMPEFKEMNTYPSEDSIKVINNYVVVKFEE